MHTAGSLSHLSPRQLGTYRVVALTLGRATTPPQYNPGRPWLSQGFGRSTQCPGQSVAAGYGWSSRSGSQRGPNQVPNFNTQSLNPVYPEASLQAWDAK